MSGTVLGASCSGQLSAPSDMLLILVLSFWKGYLTVFKHPNCHVSVSIPFLGLANGRTLNSLPGGGDWLPQPV